MNYFAAFKQTVQANFLQAKTRVKWYVWLVIILIPIGVYGFLILANDKPQVLFLNGQPLALVAGEEQVKKALDRARDDVSKEGGLPVKGFKTKLSYGPKPAQFSGGLVTEEQLAGLLKDRLEWQVEGFAICINGKNVLFLAREAEARETLDRLKNSYLSQEKGEYKLENLGFVEDVEIMATEVKPSDIKSTEEAVEILIRGLDKIEQYTVKKGDTLWSIARDNNTTVTELRDANPQLKGDFLKIGQKLELKGLEPLINVVYTMSMTVQEKIPYKIVYENDAGLFRHQQKVIQAGAYGSRQVTYRVTKNNGLETERQTLAVKVLTEPIQRVVLKGTKSMVVASRGGQWMGQLDWPLRGPITSGYGYRRLRRGSEFHAAIDINGITGDPVCAAAEGTVTFTGWCGNLGNCIAIDHGSGLVTRYGHLSSIDVSEGQKVARGSVIGKVGSTGRSTGSHLHFEVWSNGEAQNPLNYLAK